MGDKLSDSEKAPVEADLQALKDLLEKTKDEQELSDSQVDEMKAAKEKLMQSAQTLFTKVYEQAQAAGAAGPDMGATGAGPDMNAGAGSPEDDVVDGDYREV